MTADVEIPEAWRTFSAEQRAFLSAFPLVNSISAAAKQVGIHRQRVPEWERDSDLFSVALGQAKEEAADAIEAALYRRALEGQQAWDVTAGIFLLKGYRPMFRDSYTVNVNQKIIQANVNLDELSSPDKVALLNMLIDAETSGGGGTDDVLLLPPPSP